MNMDKFKPWNWFKHEEKQRSDTTSVPVQHRHQSLLSLHQDLDNLFNTALESSGFPSFHSHLHTPFKLSSTDDQIVLRPQVDISETAEKYLVTAEIPGIESDDITINVQDNLLTISGEKKKCTEDKDKNWHRVERVYGSFQRVLSLPSDADTEHMSAKFKNGVVTVEVAKTEGRADSGRSIRIEAE